MPESTVSLRDVEEAAARLRSLARAAKRRAVVCLVLCLIGISCAVASAIFDRKIAGNLRMLAQANESLRQTNNELADENARLQSAMLETQDADAVLMQKMGDLQAADRRLQRAGAQLLKWDQTLKVRLAECLR